jgi:hypothetical protein
VSNRWSGRLEEVSLVELLGVADIEVAAEDSNGNRGSDSLRVIRLPQSCVGDADGDGYGSGDGCLGADCDESNASVHEGATEFCDNGIDDDCDGLVDALDAMDCEEDLRPEDPDKTDPGGCGCNAFHGPGSRGRASALAFGGIFTLLVAGWIRLR